MFFSILLAASIFYQACWCQIPFPLVRGVFPSESTTNAFPFEYSRQYGIGLFEYTANQDLFNTTFTGWIYTGDPLTSSNIQSKIALTFYAYPWSKCMLFGNNDTHFIIRQDFNLTYSSAECAIPYNSNTIYHFAVGINQNKINLPYSKYLWMSLRTDDGTIQSCRSSELRNAYSLSCLGFVYTMQMQKLADNYAFSTQIMGGLVGFTSFYYPGSDANMERFLLNFSPNSMDIFTFQFSHEQGYCDCLVDSSENNIQGIFSMNYKTLTGYGGGGFFIFSFTQNEIVSFRAGKLRFGALTDSIYRDLNYTRLTDFKSVQSASISFWINILPSVTSFTIFSYITPTSTILLAVQANAAPSTLYSLIIQDAGASYTLSSTLAQSTFTHYIVAISSYYVDLYTNGVYTSRKTGVFKTLFQGGVPDSIIQIGGTILPISSKVQLSQVRMFSSNAVLASIPAAGKLIPNCMALYQNRTDYTCLICASGYYLNSMSYCSSSCPQTTLSSVRMCAPSCPYSCKTCNAANPLKCTSCDTVRISRGSFCDCPKGTFENYRNTTCYKSKALTYGLEMGQFEIVKDTATTVKFVNPFLAAPNVVFSIQSYSGPIGSTLDYFFISTTSISATSMDITTNTATPLYLHVQYFAYETSNPYYISDGVDVSITTGYQKIFYYPAFTYPLLSHTVIALMAGFNCVPTIYTAAENSCYYYLDFQHDYFALNNNSANKYAVTKGFIYYLVVPSFIAFPTQDVTYVASSYNPGILEKTSFTDVSVTYSGHVQTDDLLAENNLIVSLDTLNLLMVFKYQIDKFSSFRIFLPRYTYSGGIAKSTYEMQIHTAYWYWIKLATFPFIEAFNTFADCQYMDYYTMKCKKCISGKDPDTDCIDCPLNSTFVSSTCQCNAGYWWDVDAQTCLPCNNTCAECTNLTSCTVCKGSLVQTTAGVGLCSCPLTNQWNDSDGSCAYCQSTCQTCTNTSACLTCYTGMSMSGNFCICPDGQWYKEITYSCSSCYFLCATCTKYLDAVSQHCNTCSYSRQAVDGNCVCLYSGDNRIFNDDPRCSQDTTAILNAVLSPDFLTLTIDFGTRIYPNPSFINNSSSFCAKIFPPASLLVIGENSVCSIGSSSNFLVIQLGSLSRVLNLSTFTMNPNTILFYYNQQFITTYGRTTVTQLSSVTPAVLFSYPTLFNFCQIQVIQISSIQNDGGRGCSAITWTYISMTPLDTPAYNSLMSSISTANTQQSSSLSLKMYMATVDIVIVVKIDWTTYVPGSGTKTFTLNIKRQKNIIASYSLSQPSPYFRNKSIGVNVSFSTGICNPDTGAQIETTDPLDVTFSNSDISLNDSQTNLSVREASTSFAPFTFDSDYLYIINVKLALTSDNTQYITLSINLQYALTDLLVFINGGNRNVNYKSPVTLTSTLADYEQDNTSNPPSGISCSWICVEVSTGNPCKDTFGVNIPIPNTQTVTFLPYTFTAYSVGKFTLTGTKLHTTHGVTSTRTKSNSIVVFFTELDIPPLSITLDDRTSADSTINLNQIIHATLTYDTTTDPDTLYYAGAILYNTDVVATMSFEYTSVRFQVWDYFSGLSRSDPGIEIRFSVYNPLYVMPSITTVAFTVNFPPKDCTLSLTPASSPQYALTTSYSITMQNCADDNTPIEYQFFYYNSASDFTAEKNNPLKVMRKQLNDRGTTNIIATSLPAGSLVILVQAIDSREAVANITQTVTLSLQTLTSSAYSSYVANFISASMLQMADIRIVNLSLLVQDLISRGASLMAAASLTSTKTQIITLLETASSQLMSTSTLYQLAQQSIGAIYGSSLPMATTQQASTLTGISDKLTDITSNCVSSQVSQEKYSKCQENMFIAFSSIDGMGVSAGGTDAAINTQLLDLSDTLGDMLNLFSLPNENPIVFTGSVFKVQSQKITSKYLMNFLGMSQDRLRILTTSAIEPTVMDTSTKTYFKNLYSQEEAFVNYTKSLANATNNTQMTTVFPVVSPSIKFENKTSYDPKRGTVLSFQNIAPSYNLTCLSKDSKTKAWTTGGCGAKTNKNTNTVKCVCAELSPTTISQDISSLFTNNENLNTAFSSAGLANISNFTEFYLYVVFWVLSFQTVGLIALIIKGRQLDRISISLISNKNISQIKPLNQPKLEAKVHPLNQLKEQPTKIESSTSLGKQITMEKVFQSSVFKVKRKRTTNEEQLKHKNTIELSEDRAQSDVFKFSPMNTKEDYVLEKNNNNNDNQIQYKKEPTVVLKESIVIQEEEDPENEKNSIKMFNTNKDICAFNKNITLVQLDPKKDIEDATMAAAAAAELEADDFNIKPTEVTQKTPSKQPPLLRKGKTFSKAKDITQEDKQHLSNFNKYLFFLFFHDFFSIFLVYLPDLSRQVRFVLFYLRYTHTLVISIMFSSLATSIMQTIFISIFSSVIIIIVSKIVSTLLTKPGWKSKFGAIFTIAFIAFYLYLILSVQSGKKYYVSNDFIWSYVQFLAMDLLVVQTVTAMVFGLVAKKVIHLKETNDGNIFYKIFDFLKLNIIMTSIINLKK